MSETLINWPDACVFCGDSNGTIGRTANDHWKQFKCGTEYEVVGEKTAWIQDDDCKIAALMEELAAEKQQRQAAEEETKRWMELAEHQAIGRDKLGTDLAAATKRAEDAERTVAGCRDLIATLRTRIAQVEEERDTSDRAYIRGILKNRLGYVNDRSLTPMLKEAMELGIDADDIKDLAKEVGSWTQFRTRLEEWIEAEGGRHEAQDF